MNHNTRNLLKQARDYFMIVLGLAIFSFGFTAFVLPQQVVTGGMVGVASLLYYAFGWNVAVSNFGINALLLVLAFKSVGKQFTLRTVFGATAVSLLIGVMQPLFPHTLVDQQPFMNMVIGAVLCGVGIGTTYAHNGSSAGSDTIAAVVTKYSNVSFGRIMIYCDLTIVSCSYLVFHSIDKIVYGIIFLITYSFIADSVINSNRQAVQFLIFSEKWEDIANAINNVAKRGCTLLHGTGWYTKHDVKILLVLCRQLESDHIFQIVKSIDPKALITQTYVKGIYGLGFDELKVNLHKFKPEIPDETTPISKGNASGTASPNQQ